MAIAAFDMKAPRSRAESLMTSTVRYYTPGEPTTDPTTGAVTYTEVGPQTCKARVRPMSLRDFPADAGGSQVFSANFIVSVPFSQTPAPLVHQQITVTASPDPSLVGVVMQIRDAAGGDNISARRLLCYRVST